MRYKLANWRIAPPETAQSDNAVVIVIQAVTIHDENLVSMISKVSLKRRNRRESLRDVSNPVLPVRVT